MCGLAGFFGRGDLNDLRRMSEALIHRGPDGEGSYQDGEIPLYLAHRRLAIVDLIGGEQPMWDAGKDICVVYNGEIYNHSALRSELEDLGHRFLSGHSDTEVLIHGYREWGEALPGKLNGMFAFTIYDRKRRRIFMARDRFGEKPLYYMQGREVFAFASELTALISHSAVSAEVSMTGLRKLLGYGFIPSPHTLYQDCRKLPAGHYLVFDLADLSLSVKPYWQFQLNPDPSLERRDHNDLAEELRGLLREATARRLMSDVPLGLFLSGGIDSSAILALATDAQPKDQIHAFSIGFKEASFDELGYAKAVAESFGVHHHWEVLTLEKARDLLATVLGRMDEPLADPSILPTYLLCRFARKKITVALSGDGGDELFAGYDPFKALKLADWYEKLTPAPLHRLARGFVKLLPRSDKNMSLDFKLGRTLQGLSYPWPMRNPVWMAPCDPQQLSELLQEPADPEDIYEEAIACWRQTPGNLVDKTLTYFTRFYLTEDILHKVDRAAMMTSLEARAVFLDNDVVDFCQRLPSSLKYHKGTRKYLLKQAMQGVLSDDILNRPKKGFGVPASKWLRELKHEHTADGLPAIAAGPVKNLWHEHAGGQADHRLALWTLMALRHSSLKKAD
jgi:asparagine synthase (glutamine-hydrolysing)